MKKKIRGQHLLILLFFIMIITGIATIRHLKAQGLKNTYLDNISLEEFASYLDKDSDKKERIYVYIGRESCPECTIIYSTLCNIKSDNGIELLYYSTESDRELRKEEMNSLLNSIDIKQVPSIVEIENGTVITKYTGEEFVSQFIHR